MRFFRFIVCIMFVSLTLNTPIYVNADVSVSARAAVLIEKDSGRVLYSLNPDERLPMASTTKIMTASIALDLFENRLDEMIKISESASGVEGSSMYLQSGEKMSVRELLYGLLLSSGNDAAIAIAETTAQSVEDFVRLMNERAEEIGAKNTHFVNPNGLPDEEHYSTAADMAKITAYAMQNPVFCEIVATKTYKIQGEGKAYPRVISNHNKLLSMYEGCVGVKTGFVKSGGRCLCSAAERNGMTLVCVTLNAPDDWNDHIKLFDYGFENYRLERLAGTESPLAAAEVDKAYEGVVPLYAERDVFYPLRKDEKYVVRTEISHDMKAPLASGTQAGRIWFEKTGTNGETPEAIKGAEARLVVKSDVAKLSPVKKFGEVLAERLNFVFEEWAKIFVGLG